MKTLHSLLILTIASVVSSCSGASKKDETGVGGAANGASPSADQATPNGAGRPSAEEVKSLKLDDVTPRGVSALRFVGRKLAIGWTDGAIATIEPDGGEVFHGKVAKLHGVSAISPDGHLAVLAASPPAVVNIEGDLILQMNTVARLESAVFGNDGITMYVADNTGKVRIWGQPHSFEEDQHKEKMEDYLNRQAPDFHVEFAPIRGPIHMSTNNKLIVVDQDGNVRAWDPTRPSKSARLFKVGSGARSIASQGGYVFVTSLSGALKVGNDDGSGYLPWSKDAKALFVASSVGSTDRFFTMDPGVLQARNIEDGATVWSAELPQGAGCGLVASGDGDVLAACVSNFVITFDAKSGAPLAYGYRAEGDFAWKHQ